MGVTMVNRNASTDLQVNGESVQRLYQQFVEQDFIVNRRYQRKLVWAVEEKAKLIDSILQDLPIPLILLAENVAASPLGKFEIIDGLQRLDAIFSFLENRYSLEGEYFDLETLGDTKLRRDRDELEQKVPKMSREKCLEIANYRLPVSTYRSASPEAVDEVFRRINSSGKQLSLQEVRQAGVTSNLATLVRRVSSAVRGDATLGDLISLDAMARISISNRDLHYGITEQSIYWISNGILDRESVRESRDEEFVLDLLLDMILDPIAASGSEYRNSAYGRGERGATSVEKADARIQVLGEDQVFASFMLTKNAIDEALQAVDAKFAAWVITQRNPRAIPRYYHATFLAIYELLLGVGAAPGQRMQPKSPEELAKTLKSIWNGSVSVTQGGGVWGAKTKRQTFDALKAILKPAFALVSSPADIHQRQVASQFEAHLQMSITERSLFELKQGFTKLQQPFEFDEACFNKVLRTATAMANLASSDSGWIFFGVADDAKDAQRVADVHHVGAVSYGEFHVTGTEHEMPLLSRSADEQLRWLVRRIKNAPSDPEFTKSLTNTLLPFRYKGKLIWSLEVKPVDRPIVWSGEFYERVGNSTEKIDPQGILALAERFRR